MTWLTRVPVWSGVLSVILASWALGGKWPVVWPFLYGFAAISLLAACLARFSQRPGSSSTSTRDWAFLPWLFLLLWLGLALANPAYQPFQMPDGRMIFLTRPHLDWLPSTIDRERTWEKSLQLLTGLLLAWSIHQSSAHRDTLRSALWVLYVNCLVLAVTGAYYKLQGANSILGLFAPVNDTFFASFRYHNHWGGFSLLGMGIGLALAARSRLRYKKITARGNPLVFFLLSLPLLYLTLPLAGGRASMMCGTGLGLAALLWFSFRWRKEQKQAAVARWLLGMGCLGVLLFIGWLAYPVLQDRWQDTQREAQSGFTEGNIASRILAGRLTWDMYLEKPWLGWGLGSFAHVFPQFAEGVLFQGDDWLMEYAHNDWLQYLAELGAVGLFFLLAPPCILVWQSCRKWHPLNGWLHAGMIAVGWLALMDFPFSNPCLLLTTLVLLGLAWSYQAEHE